MNYTATAKTLFENQNPHANCCQAVLLPFARELGMDEATIWHIGENFGGGMRRGATCGAVTGALMALGLLGKGTDSVHLFHKLFKEMNGSLECAPLLKAAKENGEEKNDHCARMVATAAALVEQLKG